MPTLEIASLKSVGLELKQDDFAVSILTNDKLQTHRRTFRRFLQKRKGSLIHVGNPEIKADSRNIFFAGNIIDWDFDPVEVLYLPIFGQRKGVKRAGANQLIRYKFLSQFKNDIDKLLHIALEKSPIKKCCIFTNYYFGPDKETTEVIKTIEDLWKRHDVEGLVFNTMYEFGRD
jgi:hypothetical protein